MKTWVMLLTNWANDPPTSGEAEIEHSGDLGVSAQVTSSDPFYLLIYFLHKKYVRIQQ